MKTMPAEIAKYCISRRESSGLGPSPEAAAWIRENFEINDLTNRMFTFLTRFRGELRCFGVQYKDSDWLTSMSIPPEVPR